MTHALDTRLVHRHKQTNKTNKPSVGDVGGAQGLLVSPHLTSVFTAEGFDRYSPASDGHSLDRGHSCVHACVIA